MSLMVLCRASQTPPPDSRSSRPSLLADHELLSACIYVQLDTTCCQADCWGCCFGLAQLDTTTAQPCSWRVYKLKSRKVLSFGPGFGMAHSPTIGPTPIPCILVSRSALGCMCSEVLAWGWQVLEKLSRSTEFQHLNSSNLDLPLQRLAPQRSAFSIQFE